MIDGFRYGFTGHAESDLWFGGAMSGLVIAGAVLCVLADAEGRVQAEGLRRRRTSS
jgi:hypothetical protein